MGEETENKAWLISVDMGYGHQRAAHALRGIACERVITANSDDIVDPREKRTWRRVQRFYEGVSRVSGVPVVGPPLWRAYDRVQRIASLYPHRDLSRATPNVLYLDWLLRRGLSRSLVEYVRARDLPFVSTFFVPALAAAQAGLRDVCCVVTDVDISRIWVARRPREAKITYFAPSDVSRQRLQQYGVPAENVFLTGFPLPEENVVAARDDLRRRLARLDTRGVFFARQREVVLREFGELGPPSGPITVTYAVGGAGAQRDVAADILASLAPRIREERMRVNLVAGSRLDVRDFLLCAIEQLGLSDQLGRGVRVLFTLDRRGHFSTFNEWLRDTDILWSKPSEIAFFCALGLPIVMTPPLGSHEERNREWLIRMGAGFDQEPPRYAAEWLVDWLDSGMLAEAALDAYLKAPRNGTRNIRNVLFAEDRARVAL